MTIKKKPPQVGINARSDIGILYWDPSESDKKRTEVNIYFKINFLCLELMSLFFKGWLNGK